MIALKERVSKVAVKPSQTVRFPCVPGTIALLAEGQATEMALVRLHLQVVSNVLVDVRDPTGGYLVTKFAH